MVGGAISGYCAIGRVESAMTPTSVMTMLITPAKIGRSMKKCGKFMSTAVAPAPSFFVLRFSAAFHNPFSFEQTTGLEVTAFDGIIGLHDEYVFQPLLRADHSVRD